MPTINPADLAQLREQADQVCDDAYAVLTERRSLRYEAQVLISMRRRFMGGAARTKSGGAGGDRIA
jgi:hypothetical protein